MAGVTCCNAADGAFAAHCVEAFPSLGGHVYLGHGHGARQAAGLFVRSAYVHSLVVLRRYATIIGARRLSSRILLAVALSLSLHLLDCAVTASPAGQLQACFNRNASTQAPYFVEDYVTERPSRLTIHSVLWSTKLKPAQQATGNSRDYAGVPAYPLTIATMTTQHRLSSLEAQCNSWPGPLTAVVYVPLLLGNKTGNAASLQEVQALTQKLFDRVEANPTSCAMRLLLVTELLGEQSALLLFPINSLRNVALLAADTPLVAMIDVDMMLSSTLSDEFGGLAGRR
ncbi:hypothetical protein QJQ45_008321 [Haematococcus lacustris]|nr:hypothetical protein QJQ45_008321 [Haematococcus lacustris]